MSIPKLIHEVISKIENKEKDILALSARVHSKFEQIHPFGNGNGRVGRLLMNAMLLEANFAPAVIMQQQKQLYYAYLYKTQTTDDQSQLENFLCDAVVYGFEILERKDK
jgi:Fic family protein